MRKMKKLGGGGYLDSKINRFIAKNNNEYCKNKQYSCRFLQNGYKTKLCLLTQVLNLFLITFFVICMLGNFTIGNFDRKLAVNAVSTNITDLSQITDMAGEYSLSQDISMSVDSWTPLGSSDAPFTGTLDGGGYTITFTNTLTYTLARSDSPYVGIFAYASGATFKNINLNININVNGTNLTKLYVGGLVAYQVNTAVDNCHFNGAISAVNGTSDCYTYDVGGLVGGGEGSAISNCASAGSLYVEFSTTAGSCHLYVGGILGYDATSTVTYCSNSANISTQVCSSLSESDARDDIDMASSTGGIAGFAYQITNCYNIGNVVASDTDSKDVGVGQLGGIASQAFAVDSCYNLGEINSCYDAGGILWSGLSTTFSSAGNITNCFNRGDITACYDAGGILCRSYYSMNIIYGGYIKNIYNCYNTGSISSTHLTTSIYLGGILGYAYSNSNSCNIYSSFSLLGLSNLNSNLSNNIMSASTSSTQYIGGIYGKYGTAGSNCRYDYTTVVDNSASQSLIAIVTNIDNLFNASNWDRGYAWDSNIWGVKSRINDGLPYLISLTADVGNEVQLSVTMNNVRPYIIYILNEQEKPICSIEVSKQENNAIILLDKGTYYVVINYLALSNYTIDGESTNKKQYDIRGDTQIVINIVNSLGVTNWVTV